MAALRRNFRMHLRASAESSLEAEAARQRLREAQRAHAQKREAKRALLMHELSGRSELVEAELKDLGLLAPDPKARIRDEEEMVMSYLLTQVEMEAALGGDYASVMDATKTLARDVSADIAKFDEQERGSTTPEGSLFKKHRQTIARHNGALNVTLTNVRKKLKEGYASLNAKIDALDFDVVSFGPHPFLLLSLFLLLLGSHCSFSHLSFSINRQEHDAEAELAGGAEGPGSGPESAGVEGDHPGTLYDADHDAYK